ncbi:MAG TPA: hypothetical protein DD405_01075 [Desulfobacteraceae bacterium]|nr:hypothetical protein [Desulfobacteraceae bacterium]
MDFAAKCMNLATCIENILKRGIVLNPDLLHDFDSAFGVHRAGDIEKLFCDRENCEREVLLELIFYPDESMQIELEPLLEKNIFLKNDEKDVVNFLLEKKIQIPIFFPNRGDTLKIYADTLIFDSLVGRLNISKQINSKIITAVNRHIPDKIRPAVKVRLRNTRFRFYDNLIIFLNLFFKSESSKRSNFLEILDFLLNFFHEIEENNDISDSLNEKKEFYLQRLENAAILHEQLKKNNMEIMTAQNVRIPAINIPEITRKIRIIDQLKNLVLS